MGGAVARGHGAERPSYTPLGCALGLMGSARLMGGRGGFAVGPSTQGR